MRSLKTILNKIRKELTSKEKVRETAQQNMRKATSLSKQAILLIHQERFKDAKEQLKKAENMIMKIKETSTNHPEITHSGLFSDALQEYSEANVFIKLVEESKFPTPEGIEVPSISYVLALADVIGELRRLALDALRKGDTKKSEDCLKTMDEMYIELTAMDESYMLVPGLRRKCDVARKIIEITRGDVTQEIRRSALEERLNSFERHMRKGIRRSKSSRKSA